MVCIEVIGPISKRTVKKVECYLNTLTTFKTYGSIKNSTVLFQSKKLDYAITPFELEQFKSFISTILNIKSIEILFARSINLPTIIVYIKT